ncbi:hypothetical protein GCM10023317_29620 [Actinopolymorpha pittospori]
MGALRCRSLRERPLGTVGGFNGRSAPATGVCGAVTDMQDASGYAAPTVVDREKSVDNFYDRGHSNIHARSPHGRLVSHRCGIARRADQVECGPERAVFHQTRKPSPARRTRECS